MCSCAPVVGRHCLSIRIIRGGDIDNFVDTAPMDETIVGVENYWCQATETRAWRLAIGTADIPSVARRLCTNLSNCALAGSHQ